MKANIDQLETNSIIKNIRASNRGINDYKKGYRPGTNIVKNEKGDLLQTPTLFWLGGGTISLSYSMYMGLLCQADRITYFRTTSARAEVEMAI